MKESKLVMELLSLSINTPALIIILPLNCPKPIDKWRKSSLYY
jgi:hypothetical protein